MKVTATLTVFLCVVSQILASDDRLSADCLNGITDKDICCEGVPDAWYAHLRNPADCGSFYQCENGKPTWKDCPSSLHWSVSADRCEWPHLAGCEGNGNNQSTDLPTRPTTTVAPPTTIAPPPLDDQCAPGPSCHQCITGVFPADLCCRDVKTYHKLNLANANDCSSYYTCVNDHAILRQCPENLHWSIESDRCEWPENAKCEANNGGGNDGGNDGGSGNGEDGGSGGGNGGEITEECLSGMVDAEICCMNVPSEVDVLLQNNANCHTYFQCVHGQPMIRPCPGNLWWSRTANRCEWVENATCTWSN